MWTRMEYAASKGPASSSKVEKSPVERKAGLPKWKAAPAFTVDYGQWQFHRQFSQHVFSDQIMGRKDFSHQLPLFGVLIR